MPKTKTIKAWAVIDKKDGMFAEAEPDWGRYWTFKTREQSRKVKKGMVGGYGYKIVPVEIKILK